MPRHTHPAPVAKHSRGHARYHDRRIAQRNWQRAKDRYGYRWDYDRHPDDLLRDPAALFWPLRHSSIWELRRNPFNHCSCFMCSRTADERQLDRRRLDRFWDREVAEELDAWQRPQAPDAAAGCRWHYSLSAALRQR